MVRKWRLEESLFTDQMKVKKATFARPLDNASKGQNCWKIPK